jgi:hypothetical protein
MSADIDIDVVSSFDPKSLFDVAYASRIQNNELLKHPVGVYFQNIPTDPITKLAAIPFNVASDFNYFKIDMLHLSALDIFEDKTQIKALIKKEPDWNILLVKENVSKLFQLGNSFDIVYKIKPRSIMEIADCIALIRPGKRILLNKYIADKINTRAEIYKKANASDYKKSHAVAYAHIVVLQMHLISAQIL